MTAASDPLASIESLLANPTITAIQIDHNGIRYETDGVWHDSPTNDVDQASLIHAIINMGESTSADTIDMVLDDGTHVSGSPQALELRKAR